MIYQPGRAIQTEAQYERALNDLDALMDNESNGDAVCECRIVALCNELEAYEDEHYPIEPPSPLGLFIYRLQNWRLGSLVKHVVEGAINLLREFMQTMYYYDIGQTGIE